MICDTPPWSESYGSMGRQTKKKIWVSSRSASELPPSQKIGLLVQYQTNGENPPKWLWNLDQYWTFAIVIDDISTSKSGLLEKCPEVVWNWSKNSSRNVSIRPKVLNKIICMCLMCPKMFKIDVFMCILGSVEALICLFPWCWTSHWDHEERPQCHLLFVGLSPSLPRMFH